MIDRSLPAIVLVDSSAGRGSAFFIEPGKLLTNAHVVQQDREVTLELMDGSTLNARVDRRSPTYDVAVLSIASPAASQSTLPLGAASSLKPGHEVLVIGSPQATRNSVTRGVVSGIREDDGVTIVQSDARAHPGNSGGPMLDRNGNVVGILTGGYEDGSGISFAVAIEHARAIASGTLTDPGSGRGLSQLKPAGDAERLDATEQFNQRLESAFDTAAEIDAAWQRFRTTCFKDPIRGAYDREWFAVFWVGVMRSDAGALCRGDYESLSAELDRFRDYMRTTVVNARRANVPAGTIRATLQARRLSHDW